MLLANFNRKEHLRHRAVSLRQHGFLVFIGVVVTKITTFFLKCVHVGLDFCSGDLRQWVGRWDLYLPAGWLQQHAGPLQWHGRRVAIWLATACL